MCFKLKKMIFMIYCHLYTKMPWLQKYGHFLIMANKHFDFFFVCYFSFQSTLYFAHITTSPSSTKNFYILRILGSYNPYLRTEWSFSCHTCLTRDSALESYQRTATFWHWVSLKGPPPPPVNQRNWWNNVIFTCFYEINKIILFSPA